MIIGTYGISKSRAPFYKRMHTLHLIQSLSILMPSNKSLLLGSTGSMTTPSITVSHTPTAEELKTYCKEHKEWKTARNITAGVITWFDIEGVTAYNHSRPTSKDYV